MHHIKDIICHPKQVEIETRLKIIDFFNEYGAKATREAFSKSRSTIYLWKQKLSSSNGKLSSLAPGNRIPLNKRKRLVHPFIENFVLQYRLSHPGVDKTTITPALKEASLKAGIKPPSESTVGRIIHDLKVKGKLPRSAKVFLNGETGKLRFQERRAAKKKLRRKGFSPSRPGELVQIDTVDIFVDGIKRYLHTAIDLSTRFAFAYTYKSPSSASAGDFLLKLKKVSPFPISQIQTDNGSEFQKHFAQACEEEKLVHYFTYPHHPQSNGHLERFNRTIQEQFTYWNTDLLDDTGFFNQKLMEYLLWYNTVRPHRSIGKIPPLRYYLDKFVTTPQKSNMLWTLTFSCSSQSDPL
jgi:putative transposase